MWAEFQKLARFHTGLPGFLSTPISVAEADRMLAESLRNRERQFLRLVRRAIYENPGSPYLPLLRRAGARMGDIEELVRLKGLEPALEQLAKEGVQVSLDEFKGRTPIRRPGLDHPVRAADFDNPLLAGEFEVMTGGSSGRRERLTIDLDLLVFEAAARHLFLRSHDLLHRPMAIWRAVPPGSSGIKHVLRAAKLGRPAERWFSPKPVSWDRLQWKSSVFLHLALWHGRRNRGVLPRPEFVPPDRPAPAAEWLAASKRAGTPGVLSCPVSAAVRIAEHAAEHGLDIGGSVMWVGGEPLSAARERIIRAAGCSTVNGWSLSETGTLAIGCAARSERDEVHLLQGKVAVVAKPGSASPDTGAARLLLTTLLTATPKVLLNVDSGDHAVLAAGSCGCPIERAGFPQRLHTIRNADKLTAGGMHFTAADALRLIEEVLPARFGGKPGHYQLVEEEDNGKSRVALVVSPQVGPLDSGSVLKASFEYLGSHSPGHRMMSEHWARAGILEVRREEPHVSAAGKVQPLRVRVRP